MKTLSPLVRCLTAPNSNPMTGPGTNSYLVGNDQLALIDPGPLIDSHIQRLLEYVGDSLSWILVTHTHPDHSPAAKILADKTGAELVGYAMPDDGHQDRTFQPVKNLQQGDLLRTDEFCLEAIHTPGHVANQFCFLLREEGMLFSGDHIMQGSSVVIIPPSGDMSEYIESTRKLNAYPIESIAPGHGYLLTKPSEVLEGIIHHRLMREDKVVQVLSRMGESSLEDLLPEVYVDIDEGLLGMAKMSLWAHLLKLEKDHRVLKRINEHWAFGGERWVLIKT
jgi:glyoxylase-like metal-dependent hydrolase (beta-lactamase superfamily II)